MFLLFALVFVPDTGHAQETRLGLPGNVKKIFKKHCVECHGKPGERAKDLKRAKAGFDFIYDVSALLNGRSKKGHRYIVPGDPDASKLFELVKSDEMPEDAAFFVRPALEDSEKAVLKKWIGSLKSGPPGTR